MIIDADTHISPTGGVIALEEHIKRLDQHKIGATRKLVIRENVKRLFAFDSR
jgi:hypothetical protein